MKYVVYPGHGVGRVLKTETKMGHEFISIEILSTGMKILFPKANSMALGLRSIISAIEAKNLRARIENAISGGPLPNIKTDESWNRRYRNYMELIKSGNPHEMSEVVLALITQKRNQDLSFGERKMLDICLEQLNTEIELALAN